MGLDLSYVSFLEQILEHMAAGLLITDNEGRIVGANRTLQQMTGYTLEELLGGSCAIFEGDTCMVRDGEGFLSRCQLFKSGEIEQKRCTIRHKDGHRIHIVKDGTTLRDTVGRPRVGVEILTDISRLVDREREVTRLKTRLAKSEGFQGMVGQSPPMKALFQMVADAAESEAPVIIYGESGTGKELVAGAIHALSSRSGSTYLMVNCAALNENILESELFGHVRGAFTGANRTRVGRFEAAHEGSLLLDEIGDLPWLVQVKLLRVLESGRLEKVGDHTPVPVDVRIISATHRDLPQLVRQGVFRQDLFYRLNVIPMYVPPLRERRSDIPLLINHFLGRLRHPSHRPLNMSAAALQRLIDYAWPGNVRELINILEYAAVTSKSGTIQPENLPPQIQGERVADPVWPGRPAERMDVPLTADDEASRILEALRSAKGNKTMAARLLGISRVGLWKKMKRLGLAD